MLDTPSYRLTRHHSSPPRRRRSTAADRRTSGIGPRETRRCAKSEGALRRNVRARHGGLIQSSRRTVPSRRGPKIPAIRLASGGRRARPMPSPRRETPRRALRTRADPQSVSQGQGRRPGGIHCRLGHAHLSTAPKRPALLASLQSRLLPRSPSRVSKLLACASLTCRAPSASSTNVD